MTDLEKLYLKLMMRIETEMGERYHARTTGDTFEVGRRVGRINALSQVAAELGAIIFTDEK